MLYLDIKLKFVLEILIYFNLQTLKMNEYKYIKFF